MKLTLMLVVLFLAVVPSARSIEKTLPASSSVVEAGNKFCPVSGDKVSGKHFMEYQGKRYGMCCPMCEKDFKKDPEKYISKLSELERQNNQGSSEMAEHMDHDHAH